ncbi:MAG TPA: right-handed parallel beta-helix repeat-containing protein, partial [Phycisphaerales bacterium]|nr:right-handed parallel beta-helix repeat-containing protein [Phycisphaerales bacterium]
MPFKSTLPCFALVAALFATTAAKAVTRYVAPCGNDAWAGVNVNCVAPLGPKRTIQAAINASANGDSVMVLPGTYMETIDLDGKAITLNGAAGYATTIIDGGGDGPVVLCNSLEGAGTVIQGFTIRNGHSDQHGGGLFMALASPTISNCRFQNNTADSSGGGVYGVTSSATLTDCIFTGNQADQGAGAWFQYGAPTIDGCTFTANESSLHGGGLELHVVNDAEVVDCTFSSNSVESGGDGGGALHISSCAPTLTNCNFTNNTAPFGGGAISCANSNGAALSGCTFTDNSNFGCCGASAMACENSTVSLLGCNFTGNWVSQYGGAIVADSSSITMALC